MRYPLFTQRIFYSEIEIRTLNTAIAAADVVQHSSEFGLWRATGLKAGPVIADLKSCREKALLWKKTVKDTRERWFGADSVASWVDGESAPLTTVVIFDVVAVGDVQYKDKRHERGLPCCSGSVSIPGKRKKKRFSVSPLSTVEPKKEFFSCQSIC